MLKLNLPLHLYVITKKTGAWYIGELFMTKLSKPYRKLYRSRRERMIAGVCGGLAIYFDMDPSWMRLIFILFLLMGGSALLVYLIMWAVVPSE